MTVRVVAGLGSLRRRDMYLAVREATLVTAKRDDFRIVHCSIQSNHLHLIVESQNQQAIARRMQGLQISAAKHINKAIGARTGQRRRGQVFSDRYHPRALSSPRAVRHAIAYVLNNWRRHRHDRSTLASTWKLDPFSSAVSFPGWKERAGAAFLYPLLTAGCLVRLSDPSTGLSP